MKRNGLKQTVRRIPWWEPHIGSKEYRLVQKVLTSGFLNDGEITAAFENKVAALLHVQYVVACTSGTSALYLALCACGIRPGDEVIVPDLTFVATANAVVLAGATPVFVDIDPKTLTIDLQALQKKLAKRTKAIIPVHVSGRAANMQDILAVAKKHNLYVIEDAAEAFGSKLNGQALGTIGHAGCFSFTANKIITCGQGGAVATNDNDIYQKLHRLKDHGRPKRGSGGNDIHDEWGFNFKFTDVQAAVLLGQLTFLSKRLSRLRDIYNTYQNALASLSHIHLLPFDIERGESPLWIDALCENRDGLVVYLTSQRIECRKFWLPVHTHRPYKESDVSYPNSTVLGKKALWLPSSFQMTTHDVLYVCNHIKKYYSIHST